MSVASWANPAPLRVPQRLRPYVREIYGYAATGMTPGVHRGLPSSRAWVRPEVRRVWEVIQQRRGIVGVADVAREVELSPRRLSTLFAAEFGLTPKVAIRLARFDSAREAIADAAVSRGARGSLDLSRIAADRGYYDQSHMVREFAAFAGLSPTAWITEEFRNVQAGAELHAAASAS